VLEKNICGPSNEEDAFLSYIKGKRKTHAKEENYP